MTLKWGKTILSSLSLLIWPSINLSKETKIIVKQSINDKKIYTKKKTIDLLHQRCTVKLAEWFPFIINVIDIISITVNIYMHTFTCWAIEIDRNHLKIICVSIWTNRTDVPWSSWCIIINSRSLDEIFFYSCMLVLLIGFSVLLNSYSWCFFVVVDVFVYVSIWSNNSLHLSVLLNKTTDHKYLQMKLKINDAYNHNKWYIVKNKHHGYQIFSIPNLNHLEFTIFLFLL